MYSLNAQDLPEFFEDNMETWMTNFHGLLTLDNKLLQTDVSSVSAQMVKHCCAISNSNDVFVSLL